MQFQKKQDKSYIFRLSNISIMIKYLTFLTFVIAPFLLFSQLSNANFIEYHIGSGPNNVILHNFDNKISNSAMMLKIDDKFEGYSFSLKTLNAKINVTLFQSIADFNSNNYSQKFTIENQDDFYIKTENFKSEYCYFKLEIPNSDQQNSIVNLKIKPSINQQCNYIDNKKFNFDNPQYLNDNFNSFKYSGCNIGSPNFVTKKYKMLNNLKSVKWLKAKLGVQEFINIQLNSKQLNDLHYVLFFENQNKKILIDHISYEKGKQKKYAVNHKYDNLLIGIYDKNNTGQFDVIINKQKGNNDCINYKTKGDSLVVLSTSLGSPLQGPYKEGEVVHFAYKLIEWHPINNNWLHSIIPDFGLGWDTKYKDSVLNHTQTLITDNTHNELNQIHQQNFNWIKKDSIINKHKQVIQQGWYLNQADRGPKASDPQQTWGKNQYQYEGSFEKPLLEIRFKLKTIDSILDCSKPLDCSVSITPFSDYEKGAYSVKGCEKMNQSTLLAYVKCCDPNPILLNNNPFICNNDELDISLNSFNSFDCRIKAPNFDTIVNAADLPSHLSNQTQDLITYDLQFYSNENETCQDTSFNTQVIVAPSPLIPQLNNIEACKEEFVNIKINENLEKNVNLNKYEWTSLKNKFMHNLNSSANEQNFKIYDQDQLKLKITNQFECSDSTLINIDIEQNCEIKNPNSFHFSLFPNPTNGYLNIHLSQLSLPQTNLTFLNSNSQKIHHAVIKNGTNIIDVSFLDAGIYFLIIENNNQTFVEKLTVIN